MASPRVIPILKEAAKETIEKAGEIVTKATEKGSKVKTKDATSLIEKKKIPVNVGPKKTQVVEGSETSMKVSKKDFKVKKPKVIDAKADAAAWIIKNSKITPKILSDFNINNIKSKEDIIKLIEVTSRLYKDDIGKAKRGVQTNEQTKRLATILQNNPEKLQKTLLTLRPGETLNAETILAARELLVAGMGKLDELAKAAVGGTADDTLKFRQHFALMGEFQKVLKGVQTETARALQQFNIQTRQKNFSNVNLDTLNQEALLIEMGGVEDIQGVARLYLNAGSKNAKMKIAQEAGAVSNLRKASDSVAEIFINAILSNPLTHVRNSAGNWLTSGINALERKAAVKMFGGTETGGLAVYEDIAKAYGKHQAAQEMMAALSVAFRKDGIGKFLQNFDKQVKSEFGGTSKIELRPNQLSSGNFNIKNEAVGDSVDLIGRILTLDRVPTKMLTVMDNWFKNQEYRSELYAVAYRESMELFQKGLLKKENMADFIADRVVNPTKTATKEAYDLAHYVTYQTKLASQKGNKLAEFGNLIQKGKSNSGFMSWLANYYLPFVQTPTNIAGFVSERTPILAQTLTRYNADIAAGGVRKQMALTRLRLGSLFYTATAPLGYFSVTKGSNIDVPGKTTGGKNEILKALGIQPNDIRIPVGDGKSFSLNTTGFDPINMMLSMSANSGKYLEMMFSPEEGHTDFSIPKAEDALAHTLALTVGFGEILANSTFLMGVGDLNKDITNASKAGAGDISKGEFGKKWWNKFSSSFIPTGFKQTAKLWEDDYRKLAIEWDEYMLRNINDNSLQNDYTIFGETINKFGYLNSFQMTPAKEAFQKVMPKISPIDKTFTATIGAGISVSTPLKSDELRFVKKNAGIFFNIEMNNLVEGTHVDSELFNNPKTEELLKQTIIKKILSGARTDAKDLLREEELTTNKGTVQNDMHFAINERLMEAKQLKILTSQRGKKLQDDNLDYNNQE